MNAHADMVFEVSFEVTNKCGGIHTVVTTKVPLMQAHYDNYCLIGPLFDDAPADLIPLRPPESYAKIFSQLSQLGIRCAYGTWDILGKPNVVLIDARALSNRLNEFKSQFWEQFGIDSINARWDFDEPLLWSVGVGMFLEQIGQQFPSKKIIGHFHEWLSGFAILYLKAQNANISTVFTTHATMLGRSTASRGKEYFKQLGHIDPLEEARTVGVEEKYTTEKACALAADVFTTVSPTTALEAESIFGRKPDILPNGLPIDSFPTFEEASYSHRQHKQKLFEFVMSHYFPYQLFNLKNTLFFYASGRYEFENKGLDITIEALARLNNHLKDIGSKRTVVMLFLVAMNAGTAKRELLENKSHLEGLFEDVEAKESLFLQNIVLKVMMGDRVNVDILPDSFLQELRRKFRYLRRHGNPLICTHNIDESKDPIVQNCQRVGLTNKDEDKVKVVFVPTYLHGRDGLLNMEYYEVVSACHLGIFPSYYEPWGYTPLESIAYGVPAITSNTAGFGQYIEKKVVGKRKGMYIIDRTVDREQEISQLFEDMLTYANYDLSSRVACKMNAHALATYADWRQLIRYYICAHNKALGVECDDKECRFEG